MSDISIAEPKISVIVPVFNVEKYLPQCIDSIINQSYKNLEVILVDDGSPDKSGIICDEYSRADHRIIVFHQKNKGLSAARNAGIESSHGEYICFVDSDDYIKTDFVEKLYCACIEYQCDISMCHYFVVMGSNEKIYEKYKETCVLSGIEMCKEACEPQYIVAWNKLYKRYIFDSIRYPEGKLHEDLFTTYKCYYLVKSCAIVNEQLYGYRLNQDGIVRKKYSQKRLDELKAIKEQSLFYRDVGNFDLYYYYIVFWIRRCIYHLSELKKNYENDSEVSRDLVRTAREYLNNIPQKYLGKIMKRVYSWGMDNPEQFLGLSNRLGKIKRYCNKIWGIV